MRQAFYCGTGKVDPTHRQKRIFPSAEDVAENNSFSSKINKAEKGAEIDHFSCKFFLFESEAQNSEISNRFSLGENSNSGIAGTGAERVSFSCIFSCVETIRLGSTETEAENNSFGSRSDKAELTAECDCFGWGRKCG